MTTIESRLATVERQLLFHRAVIAALLVALVALVGLGATEGVPDVIRAKRVEVVDEDGKVWIGLRADSKGAGIAIGEVAHGGKAGIGVLALREEKVTAFGISGEDGQQLIAIGMQRNGDAFMMVSNRTGHVVASAGPDDFGHGVLRVCHRTENKCKPFRYAP